jgi:hypothetical protein
MHVGFLWESQKERNHWEDVDVGGIIILKWMLERWDVLAQVREQSRLSFSRFK